MKSKHFSDFRRVVYSTKIFTLGRRGTMYKKNLWRSVIAGTLALAMTLTPVGS